MTAADAFETNGAGSPSQFASQWPMALFKSPMLWNVPILRVTNGGAGMLHKLTAAVAVTC